MKILYLGTACREEGYEKILSLSREKVSVASNVFENALLKAVSEKGVMAEVISFPIIPHANKGGPFAWGRKRETLTCGVKCTWIPTVNLPLIKPVSRLIFGRAMVKRRLKNRDKREETAVLMYSVCPFLAPAVLRLGRRYGVKCFCIAADLPRNMFINHPKKGVAAMFAKAYINRAVKVQSRFDGYVYLTENMRDEMGADAPYTIVESMPDITAFEGISNDKSEKRAVMYAGGLHEKYGVENLIKAFYDMPHENTELWLFGTGGMEKDIKTYAMLDPAIRYFGQRPHREVLINECRASVLICCRGMDDDYVKYSFPSKLTEFMLSGTPVILTALPGIPNEYLDRAFTVADNSPEKLAEAMERVLMLPQKELNAVGLSAREFIITEKSPSKQADKILSLIYEVCH